MSTELPSSVPVVFEVGTNGDGEPSTSVHEKTGDDWHIGSKGADEKYVIDTTLTSATGTVSFTLPEYSTPGKYTYKLIERASTIAGVTSNENEYTLTVYAKNNSGGTTASNDLVCDVTLVKTDEVGDLTEKTDTIENTYKAGKLKVTKVLAGDLADHDDEFTFTLTLTSDKVVNSAITATTEHTGSISLSGWTRGDDDKYTATCTFVLKAGQSANFINIPYGVSYSVSEASDSGNDGQITKNGIVYEITSDGDSGTIGSTSTTGEGEGTVTTTNIAPTATFTNTAGNTSVDTGVILDTAPYVLVLGVVAAGVVLMVMRKRRDEE